MKIIDYYKFVMFGQRENCGLEEYRKIELRHIKKQDEISIPYNVHSIKGR